MSAITESELITRREGLVEQETYKEGPDLRCTYYRFLIELPQTVLYQELSDEEILTLAEKTGTFDFLYGQEEDIYDSSDGTPYEKR